MKSMRIFEDVPGLVELELAERWEEAIDLLYQRWLDDKNNVSKLCMVLFECWCVMIDPKFNESARFLAYQEKLNEVTKYGIEYCSSDLKFLWVAGYCISLFPFLFYCNDKGKSEWDHRGEEMLLQATNIDPDNLIARVFYHGCFSDHSEYLWTKVQLMPMLKDLFPGSTAIERYFREILTIANLD